MIKSTPWVRKSGLLKSKYAVKKNEHFRVENFPCSNDHHPSRSDIFSMIFFMNPLKTNINIS